MAHRDELFFRVGVVDGLRLQQAPEIRFHMQASDYELPSTPPSETPQEAWDEWRRDIRETAKPDYTSWFEYSLSGINLLPEIHLIDKFSQQGRNALSRLLLTSLPHWPDGWQKLTVRKREGVPWLRPITSPLRHWLKTLPWLVDGAAAERPLGRRWLIPTSFLRGQHDRFRHLNALSLNLSSEIEADPELKQSLTLLGLNVYPVEDEEVGPELLEALAVAWAARRVSGGRFDVLLGQVRHAWRHLDPHKGLPDTLLVRTGHRMFSTRAQDDIAGVYLPDNRDRTRSLLEHGKHVLEMHVRDAGRMANALLSATDIRRSSALAERFLVDGAQWTGVVDRLPSLAESAYRWLPVTLLTIAAHGGADPTGAATKGWREATNRLRRASMLECETIVVQLVDGDEIVAGKEPAAEWLPGDVLAIRRDLELRYEALAPVAQAMLERQDLLKDLRLVLGALSSRQNPTVEQIVDALERAEIDSQEFADIRNHWAGTIEFVVDRIRPVLVLLGANRDGFDVAAAAVESLTEWLSSIVPQWPAAKMISAARTSRDDHAMGLKAWDALGDIAQLPPWNVALTALGDRYGAVENHYVRDQITAHLEGATPLLRGLARHIAIEVRDANVFHKLESVSRSFEAPSDWAGLWWEVPFTAVTDALSAAYAEIPGVAGHLSVFRGPASVDGLRTALKEYGVGTEPDPYEIARRNKERRAETLSDVHDLYRTWLGRADPNSAVPRAPHPPDDLDPEAYLQYWSEAELLRIAFQSIGDSKFVADCDGCGSLAEIRDRLQLDPESVEAHRRERREREREEARERRTFTVAGMQFEVGPMSFTTLFAHIDALPPPEGPRASTDDYTPLETVRAGRSGGGAGRLVKTAHLRPRPELLALVGVVGEIHAYRYLREEFGRDAVTPDAWVSEIRPKVLPLVVGEPDKTSDGHGFDFQFSFRRTQWHIEVKSTTGDDAQFDLGISEIKAATRFARARGGRWRILRVRRALAAKPEFDWLPNPFQDGFKEHFRLHRGGMRVSYARRKA